MRIVLIAAIALIGLLAPSAHADSWICEPIVVHEWGVEAFDWSQGAAARPTAVPNYMYTDEHPGDLLAMPAMRVKDLPPDSGMRDKPILYFYPNYRSAPIPIGVELRFAEGQASAWYPQANVYRSPAIAAAGHAAEPIPWKKSDRFSPRNPPLQIPDDTRMELAWYSLALSKDLPAGASLAGKDLPADHWTKLARDIPDAAYVSNGNEVEKYLFYEGETRESPAVAVVRAWGLRTQASPFHVVNISDRAIFDVFAIYHAGGHTWVGFVPSLEPIKPGAAAMATLPLPDFTGTVAWTDPKSLHDATTGRLLSSLTGGGTLLANPQGLRDPADPQGPTANSQLFPDEAAALEKIWRHQFFEPGAANGLTILYRQSPESLDADMPLKLYTNMYHYIALSRCGLVLVTNIDIDLAVQSQSAVDAATGSNDPKVRGDALAFLRQHPGVAMSALGYLQRIKDYPACESLRQELATP
jgi:hypothetical protein